MESSFSALENFTRAQQWAEEEVDHSLEHPWRGVVEESGQTQVSLFRQELGIYICFLLAPVQTALYRAAQAGELGERTLRLVNLVAGVVVELLVLDGRAQVSAGTASFAALDKSDPFYAVLVGKLADPDAVGRASTNTTAAFSVGLLVGLVYLATALIKKPKAA